MSCLLRRSTHVWPRHEAPVFTVQSVIGRSDDLVAGTSYYQDEVEAVLISFCSTSSFEVPAPLSA